MTNYKNHMNNDRKLRKPYENDNDNHQLNATSNDQSSPTALPTLYKNYFASSHH